MSAVAPAPARATIVESSSRRAPRASAETPRAPAPLSRARNALAPRVVASRPTRGRVVVRLAPRAVATGGPDLKISATPDDDDSPDLASRSDASLPDAADGAPADPETRHVQLADDAADDADAQTEAGGGDDDGRGGDGDGGDGDGAGGNRTDDLDAADARLRVARCRSARAEAAIEPEGSEAAANLLAVAELIRVALGVDEAELE